MTMSNENQGYPLPAQPAEPFSPEDVGSEEIPEEQAPPPMNEDDVNYIPETGLTAQDEEDIFGTGERADGSIDEMERTDIDDLTGDEDDDFSDVLSVSEEDIMGKAPEPKRPKQFRRTNRPYTPPPPSVRGMGGLQY